MITVLVVDDQYEGSIKPCLDGMIAGFTFIGHQEFDVDAILNKLKENPEVTVLLLDIMTPDFSEAGISLFKQLGENVTWIERNSSIQIVFFSDEATTQREFNVSKEKRFDVAGYVEKANVLRRDEPALNILRQASERAKRHKKFPSLANPIRKECELLNSPNTQSMESVWENILLAGRCWEPVLIQGETGTGKELVARAIDKVMKNTLWGQKKPPGIAGKMISYNIGSAPQEGNLQYTELFGAIEGAYSGCESDRIGVFERASQPKPGRTIFLDEIGDAPRIVQVALLRVLQEKKIIPLGGFAKDSTEIERKVRFRLIAASHRDLPDRVDEGEFREDLYYRMNTIEIQVPPLRDRLDDIPVLAYHFLEKINKEFEEYGMGAGKYIPPVKTKSLFELLKSYSWPGNVRQLESFIRRSYVMSPGEEFVLSEDIEQLINGREPSSHAVIEDVKGIKKSLLANPIKLPELRKKHGLRAIKVARLVIEEECGGSMPNKEQAQRWFNMNYDACRKWMNSNGIEVRQKAKN